MCVKRSLTLGYYLAFNWFCLMKIVIVDELQPRVKHPASDEYSERNALPDAHYALFMTVVEGSEN